MIRTRLGINKVLISLSAVLLFAGVSFAATDWCYEFTDRKENDKAVAACSESIKSNKVTGKKLAMVYFNRAMAHFNMGDYDKAIADSSKSIQLFPKNSGAYYNRGVAYVSKGEYDKAISDYSKAIELDPQNPDAYNNRGVAYSNKGDYDKALADYDKVIDLGPKNADVYYNMACLHSLKNNTEEACSWFGKAIGFGYSDWEHIKVDKDLDNIRKEGCYKMYFEESKEAGSENK